MKYHHLITEWCLLQQEQCSYVFVFLRSYSLTGSCLIPIQFMHLHADSDQEPCGMVRQPAYMKVTHGKGCSGLARVKHFIIAMSNTYNGWGFVICNYSQIVHLYLLMEQYDNHIFSSNDNRMWNQFCNYFQTQEPRRGVTNLIAYVLIFSQVFTLVIYYIQISRCHML